MQVLHRSSFFARQTGVSKPVLLTLVAVAAVVGWRLVGRVQAQGALREQTSQLAQPTVSFVTPRPGSAEDLPLPGSVQAWADAPIYARTGGYLKRWLVDIGQPVKAGQLLAEIDAPEVDQQLRQAEADLAAAEVNLSNAQRTAERYKQLLASQSVAPQEAEDKIGDAQAKQAAAAAQRANVQRLREIAGFKRMVAPFDGVVTARSVDVGALVVPGGASGPALFRVASTRKLRVYVDVPESLAGSIAVNQMAELRLSSQPRQAVAARVVSTATAIAPASRTLLTQLEVDNPRGELLPGAYAEVRFKLPARLGALRVPGNTLLFRADGLSVATVDAHERVLIKPVVQGRDFGKEVEIVSGLQANDRVIVNPSDSAVSGTPVRAVPAPVKPAAPAAPASVPAGAASAGSAAK
jgi:RND family efflux transporter MFP subunit